MLATKSNYSKSSKGYQVWEIHAHWCTLEETNISARLGSSKKCATTSTATMTLSTSSCIKIYPRLRLTSSSRTSWNYSISKLNQSRGTMLKLYRSEQLPLATIVKVKRKRELRESKETSSGHSPMSTKWRKTSGIGLNPACLTFIRIILESATWSPQALESSISITFTLMRSLKILRMNLNSPPLCYVEQAPTINPSKSTTKIGKPVVLTSSFRSLMTSKLLS